MTRLGFRTLQVLSAVALCVVAVGCTESPHTVPASEKPRPLQVGSLDALGTTSEATTPAAPQSTTATPSPAPAVQPALTEDDARYAVRRYLSRWIGQPLRTDDTEGKYPLVCSGSILSNNPGRLTGTTAFDADKMTARRTGDAGAEVTVPVTNSSSVTAVLTFSLRAAASGYCIWDIAS
ncbi:hypothetical protein [Nocardia aurantiaca]|uniref:Lipoprotein n=1 Tax=Nocardia aurantiaca TaxID=2675850 RepID=A0A6I3L2L7_9NOCA|nr:hypothetical protein [Nocardia aurantiaca]MTE17273.1 hypothetical protein [Nocardia aurantiaca]